MKHTLTAVLAVSLLAGAVATAQADDHGQHGGSRHQQHASQSHGQSHDFRPGNFHAGHSQSSHFRPGNSRPGPSFDRRDSGYRGNDGRRHDWDSRRGFDGVRFGEHRFVDRHSPRNVFPARNYRNDGRYRVGRYYPPYGYRSYAWRRGDRLPVAYYAPRYVVRDYWSYRLGAPPRGYYWVRVNNDVLLTAITTGIVVQVVNDLFW